MMNNSTVKYSMRYVLVLKRIKKYENLTFDDNVPAAVN